MLTRIRYGQDATLSLDLSREALVADCAEPHGFPLDDTVAAVQAALAAPLGFPPLANMVLPGDRVVVALEEGAVCAPALVAGTVGALVAAGSPPESIRVLRASGDRAIPDSKITSLCDESWRERIEVLKHEPSQRKNLGFLATSKEDQPIYVNRELCDADVVLPVGTLHSHDRVGYLGVNHGWFPAFADTETQRRFHKSQSSLAPKQLAKRRRECDDAAWSLGIQMIVQLVPAGIDRAMHVLAGASQAVCEKGNDLMEGTWRFEVERRASLVVAAIAGGPEQQTWQNITRTLSTALDAVEDDGSIAICSQLKTKPGPALRRLAGAEDFEAADRETRRKPTADALSAARLNQALQRTRVYLLSELDERDVEDMGLAHVADAREIAKLSARHDSCLVLGNGQHIAISISTESAF